MPEISAADIIVYVKRLERGCNDWTPRHVELRIRSLEHLRTETEDRTAIEQINGLLLRLRETSHASPDQRATYGTT